MSPGIKNIAYGVSDFERIQTESYYLVDKTRFVPLKVTLNDPLQVSIFKSG